MPKKSKKKTRIKIVKEKRVRIIEPELMLERELALEDHDLRRAKVATIFEGFHKDRDKRREQLRGFMNDLRIQRMKRREEMQKFMQSIRSKVLEKKKMMPEVRV